MTRRVPLQSVRVKMIPWNQWPYPFCCFHHLEIGYISWPSGIRIMGSFGNTKYWISILLRRLMLVTLFQKNKTNNTPIHFLLKRMPGATLKRRKDKSSSRSQAELWWPAQFFSTFFFTLFHSPPHRPHPNATYQEHGCSDVVDSKEKSSSAKKINHQKPNAINYCLWRNYMHARPLSGW